MMILLELFFFIIYLDYCVVAEGSALVPVPLGCASRGLICHHRCWTSWNRIVLFTQSFWFNGLFKNFSRLLKFRINIFQEWVLLDSTNMKRKMTRSNCEYGKWRFSKVRIFWVWVGAVLWLKWFWGEKLKINSERNIAEGRWCFWAEDSLVSFVDYLLLKSHRILGGSFALCAAPQASLFYWVRFSVCSRFLQMQKITWDTGVNLLVFQPSCRPPYSDLLLQLSQKLVFCFKAVITWSQPKCDLVEWAVRGFLVAFFFFNSWRL